MRAAFLADCRRLRRNDHLSLLQVLQCLYRSEGLKALFAYRLGRHLLQLRAERRAPLLRLLGWPLYWLVRGYASRALDIRLELSADIGPGLYIGHFGGILVRGCRIGSHCSIAQSTRIEPGPDAGESEAARALGGPVIGDRVWIGAHVHIIGTYEIGDRSTVSAGALVKRDIPAGALFLGRPGRVIMSDYDNSDIL